MKEVFIFWITATASRLLVDGGNYYGKDLWYKSLLERSIQKRKTPENQNSIDVHCSIFPVYYADLDVFRLVNERVLIRKGKGEKIMKSQVLNITGGFYTAVVVKFELFESSIIDERYFATREEAEAFQRVIIEKRFNDLENIACVVSRIG